MVFMHKTVGYSLSQRIIIVMFITQKSLLPDSNIPTEHWHDGNDRSAKSLVTFLPVPKPKGDCIKKHPPVQPAPTADGRAGRGEGGFPHSPGGKFTGIGGEAQDGIIHHHTRECVVWHAQAVTELRRFQKAGGELKVTVMQIKLQKKCSQVSLAARSQTQLHIKILMGKKKTWRCKYQSKGLQETGGERAAVRRGRSNTHR